MIALFSPLAAGAPIAMMLSQGYPFVYTLSALPAFDLLAAAALFIILPNGKQQYYKAAFSGRLCSFSYSQLKDLTYFINSQ